MSNIIGIVNYGIAGNIHSIKKAIEKAGGKVLIIDKKEDLKKVDKIVIPGVGSFNDAMIELQKNELLEPLKKAIQSKPTLGICLGMQILSTLGFEYGKTQGLDVIKAEVKPILVDAKIPHIGFNNIDIVKSNPLLAGLENEEFYFMHSYEVVNFHDVITTTEYAEHLFVSAIQKDNVFGVQFHPEKSREAGIKLFKNFIDLGI
ncbi:imidazole glycerol phosphate synthase subunit HisH [Aliarcobacter butzleri]|uniref:imidazole glycerol phosphate synthase subunit HisH n=1 Tax=Aliarcobacter butzleri TaxID=28197 RepID=UPI0021B4B821|nr:imidazole glycerol phosphate synthase subunit HisH [Aliarcobacter butzleri]MCT7648035.1 imidazole glycerol phosphate synthase subunit HisH [Aliarcobacter butzleri]